jgi:hypothetical protein
MPPRKRNFATLRRIGRVFVAMLVALVFAALWLLDTGALLHLAAREIAAHKMVALGVVASVLVALLAERWLRRRKPTRGRLRKNTGRGGGEF